MTARDEKHLCDSCLYVLPICHAKKITWSIDKYPDAEGADADKVLECDRYKPKINTHAR